LLADKHHPLGEIAHVDHLDRIVGAPGHEHVAALVEARGPVREAIGRIGGPTM
jgi:hypothetical protein